MNGANIDNILNWKESPAPYCKQGQIFNANLNLYFF